MPRQFPGEICQRVRRVRHDENHRPRCSLDQTRYHIAIDGGIGMQQPQSAARVAAIRGTASAFIDAGRNHNQVRAGKVGVVTFD
jgi:hypothetical protein